MKSVPSYILIHLRKFLFVLIFRYISMLRSFKCMILSNHASEKVHLSLNVLEMYDKCKPDVHLSTICNNNNRKNRYFFKFATTKHFLYISITKKKTGLLDVHPGYISSTFRVHFEYIWMYRNVDLIGPLPAGFAVSEIPCSLAVQQAATVPSGDISGRWFELAVG